MPVSNVLPSHNASRVVPGSNVLPSHNAPTRQESAGIDMLLDLAPFAGDDGGVKGFKPRGKDKKPRAPRKCKRCVRHGGAAPSVCTGASTRKTRGECDYFHPCGTPK